MFHDDGNEVQTLKHRVRVVLGRGLLSQFSPFRYFPHFSLLSKQTLAIEYRVYIWQVSPQLSCGDTCQIWMWFRDSNRYFCKIENFAYGEISERSFSNPHPRKDMYITIEFSYHGLPLLNSVPALVISWYVSFFEWCSRKCVVTHYSVLKIQAIQLWRCLPHGSRIIQWNFKKNKRVVFSMPGECWIPLLSASTI